MPVTAIPQYQHEGAASTADVAVADVTIASVQPVIQQGAHRRMTIQNTGDVPVEVCPRIRFQFGTGFLLQPGESLPITYNGPIYACVESGQSRIRAWLEG